MKRIFIILLILAPLFAHAQSSYIVEQLGRDEHQIVQSLGAFVGNEHAESQAFDITFMPAGASVQGVMIINTADYRCTFRMEKKSNECVKVELIVRSADFLRDFHSTPPPVTNKPATWPSATKSCSSKKRAIHDAPSLAPTSSPWKNEQVPPKPRTSLPTIGNF